MNLFAAASAPGSTVRNVVVKSSTLVYGAHPKDPVWFSEETRRRPAPARPWSSAACSRWRATSATSRSTTPHVNVAMLRFSNVLGPDITTPLAKALELPVVPSVFGFDPRFQFVHETDVVRAILFVLARPCRASTTWPATGCCPWSEVAAICGKRTCPAARRSGSGLLSSPLAPGSGSTCRPSCSTCCATAAASTTAASSAWASTTATRRRGRSPTSSRPLRLRRTVGSAETAYQYERDVEQFFRHSPAVVRDQG